MSSKYQAIKTVPVEMEELRLVEQLTLPGSPEHLALEKLLGTVSRQLTEKDALAILVRLGADVVKKHLQA